MIEFEDYIKLILVNCYDLLGLINYFVMWIIFYFNLFNGNYFYIFVIVGFCYKVDVYLKKIKLKRIFMLICFSFVFLNIFFKKDKNCCYFFLKVDELIIIMC